MGGGPVLATYQDFISRKHIRVPQVGITEDRPINGKLFDFQRMCVDRALKAGKFALFTECGSGKTAMQAEWSKQVAEHTGGDVLILAPLAVAAQTVAESVKPIVRVNGFERYIGDPEQDPREYDAHPSKYARKGRDGRTSVEIWRRYAEPVWWDIDQTDVLNFRIAKDEKDEKHICPLQLGLIRRCVELWSSPGDVVLSPFAGVGSEGYVAVEEGRKFVGIELKPGYYSYACKYLAESERLAGAQGSLWGDE